MTTTFSLPLSALGDSFPIELTRIDRDTIDSGSPVVTANGGHETLYRFISGDPTNKSQLRVGDYPPSRAGASYNKSVRLTTYVKRTNSVTGEEAVWPFSVVVSISDGSGIGIPDVEDVLALVMMTVSAFVPGSKVADDAPETAAVTRMAFGTTEIMHVAVEQ